MTVALENATRIVGAVPFIRDVSLTLEPGTLTVLLGATQAGKTTLMRLMAGLDTPTTGRVLVDGKDVTGIGARAQRRDGLPAVHQLPVDDGGRQHRLAAAASCAASEVERARAASSPSQLHIEPFLDRLPAELSGGQQQRVALARALAKNAPLMLLDEPLVNLDYKLREELRDELTQLFAARALDRRLRHHRAHRGAAAGRLHRRAGGRRLLQYGPTRRGLPPADSRCAWRAPSAIRR